MKLVHDDEKPRIKPRPPRVMECPTCDGVRRTPRGECSACWGCGVVPQSGEVYAKHWANRKKPK